MIIIGKGKSDVERIKNSRIREELKVKEVSKRCKTMIIKFSKMLGSFVDSLINFDSYFWHHQASLTEHSKCDFEKRQLNNFN